METSRRRCPTSEQTHHDTARHTVRLTTKCVNVVLSLFRLLQSPSPPADISKTTSPEKQRYYDERVTQLHQITRPRI